MAIGRMVEDLGFILMPQESEKTEENVASVESTMGGEIDIEIAPALTKFTSMVKPIQALLYEPNEPKGKEQEAEGGFADLPARSLPLADARISSVYSKWEMDRLNNFGASKHGVTASGILGDDYASQMYDRSGRERDGTKASSVTFSIRNSSGNETHFKVSSTIRMRKAFEVYAQKHNLPAKVCASF